MAKEITKTNVLGLMSGTSLDGLDLAHCTFFFDGKNYCYEINKAETIEISSDLKSKIINAQNLSGRDLMSLDADLGIFFGKESKVFLDKYDLKTDFIASHGQTIFHEPQNGFTTQIGSAAHIYAQTNISTIFDFRSLDVALGGNGAPLVPIGDLLLFKEYDFCLNLGGFANISVKKVHEITAFDICACNYVLNYLCRMIGQEFDHDGEIAFSNQIDSDLLKNLDNLAFYKTTGPKSLGREWVEKEVFPILNSSEISIEEKIATYSEHIAQQINYVFHQHFSIFSTKKILITGGGAFNKYIIERVVKLAKGNAEIVIPTREIICFKEALIFAFLGYLRICNKENVLFSVTGAKQNHIAGSVIGVF